MLTASANESVSKLMPFMLAESSFQVRLAVGDAVDEQMNHDIWLVTNRKVAKGFVPFFPLNFYANEVSQNIDFLQNSEMIQKNLLFQYIFVR